MNFLCSAHDWMSTEERCPYHGDHYLELVEAVRAARVLYAEEFLRFRVNAKSDGQAHQQAIKSTNDELTTLEARLYLARRDLDRS